MKITSNCVILFSQRETIARIHNWKTQKRKIIIILKIQRKVCVQYLIYLDCVRCNNRFAIEINKRIQEMNTWQIVRIYHKKCQIILMRFQLINVFSFPYEAVNARIFLCDYFSPKDNSFDSYRRYSGRYHLKFFLSLM